MNNRHIDIQDIKIYGINILGIYSYSINPFLISRYHNFFGLSLFQIKVRHCMLKYLWHEKTQLLSDTRYKKIIVLNTSLENYSLIFHYLFVKSMCKISLSKYSFIE